MIREKIKMIRDKILGQKEEEIEIPEAWLHPEQTYGNPMDWLFHREPTTPQPTKLAVKPSVVFEEPRKTILPSLGLPWLKFKRVTAFLLLMVSGLSIIGFVMTPFTALLMIYFVPVTIILLDYLLRTQETQKTKWYVLDDIEDDK